MSWKKGEGYCRMVRCFWERERKQSKCEGEIKGQIIETEFGRNKRRVRKMVVRKIIGKEGLRAVSKKHKGKKLSDK